MHSCTLTGGALLFCSLNTEGNSLLDLIVVLLFSAVLAANYYGILPLLPPTFLPYFIAPQRELHLGKKDIEVCFVLEGTNRKSECCRTLSC